MIISKKHYDELNARNVKLMRALREKEEEENEYKKENALQHETLRKILKAVTINRYGNAEVTIRKVKELVNDYQSNN